MRLLLHLIRLFYNASLTFVSVEIIIFTVITKWKLLHGEISDFLGCWFYGAFGVESDLFSAAHAGSCDKVDSSREIKLEVTQSMLNEEKSSLIPLLHFCTFSLFMR